MTHIETNRHIVNDAIAKDIVDTVHSLRYGTVMITVHDGKIVQMETSHKRRFDDVWKLEGGAGI